MNNVVVYPGTFDPITNGHLDIITRASKMFSFLIIAVAKGDEKNPMFSLEDRVKMVELSTKNIPNIEVDSFSNLLAEYAKHKNTKVIIRGLRAISDFEYEFQMNYANSSLNEDLETIYLMPSIHNVFISSSMVRSILKYGGNISHIVPPPALSYINKI